MSVTSEPTVDSAPPDLDRRAYARAVRRVIVLLIVVGVTVRVARFLLPAAVWGDEAMLGLNLVTRDYVGLTRQLDHQQVAPILFLWAEKFVIDSFGMSEYAVRLVPLLAGLAGLIVFWDLARRVLPPTAAACAVGLLAASPWPVGMSANLKPYSGDLFWSALLLALAARWHRRPERVWPLAALAVAVPLAVGASYPVVFVAGGVSLYLLPLARRSGWAARLLFVGYNAALVASFALVFALVGREQVSATTGNTGEYMYNFWRAGFPPDSARDVPLWLLDRHTNQAFAYPIGDDSGGSTATALLCLAGALWCWRNGSRPLLVLCLVPFALNLVAAVMGKYPYTASCRLSQHLAPAICLLAGAGFAAALARLVPRRDRRLAAVRWWAGGLIVFAAGALAVRASDPDYNSTCRAARRMYLELDRAHRPGDLVAVPADVPSHPSMDWYLHRLGDRVVRLRPDNPPPTAPRVWVVSHWYGKPDDRHRWLVEFVRRPDSSPGHTTWYTVRAVRGRDLPLPWLSVGVTCVYRTGDPEPPLLNAAP